MPGIDNINELIENINKEGHHYIIGLIKENKESNTDNLEIFTNIKAEPASQLIKILREHQKTVKSKKETNGNKEK